MMNKETPKILGMVLALVAVIVLGYLIVKGNDRIETAEVYNTPADGTIPPQEPPEGQSGEPGASVPGLKVPAGFKIEVFAKNLPGARVIEFDNEGDMWVSQTKEGKITELDVQNGKVVKQNAVFRNLNRPHGIAIKDNFMYFAEETKITRVGLDSDDPGQEIADLPKGGGGHYTRTIEFGPDGRLYVSIGSSCNVCDENDPRRAAIYSMNADGSDFRQFAKGLRNTVFFTWDPVRDKMWGPDMGRDNLGDNIPPDEINIIEAGKNYGWPICYGKNIHDTNFDKKTYIRNPCMEPFETGSYIDLQAHSAPLGLAFVPEEGWPEDMWYDLLVAYHGSWNRSVPTGYKIVRLKINAKGEYLGTEDFITGFLKPDGSKLGRPVDIRIFPGGTAYISDDEAGVIYKLSRTTEEQ